MFSYGPYLSPYSHFRLSPLGSKTSVRHLFRLDLTPHRNRSDLFNRLYKRRTNYENVLIYSLSRQGQAIRGRMPEPFTCLFIAATACASLLRFDFVCSPEE